jgi:glutamate N-acetyltransferase/amino-acid N-acetyltransferase
MAAAGRAGIPLVVNKIDVYLGKIKVVKAGEGTKYSEAAAKKVFMQKEVRITLDLHQGKGKAIYYTCDFSFDYVKINASYRS